VLKKEDGSIQLSIGSSFSPRQSLIVYQCCGLVLDKDFNLICSPFNRFHPHDANQQMEIDWASAVVTEKPVGINISMFFQKEWKLSKKMLSWDIRYSSFVRVHRLNIAANCKKV
jgi:hypothetical protein